MWQCRTSRTGHRTVPAESSVLAKGIAGFQRYSIEDERGFRLQSCISPVWDTGLAVLALQDAGLPPDHPALVRAGTWLLWEQIFVGDGLRDAADPYAR